VREGKKKKEYGEKWDEMCEVRVNEITLWGECSLIIVEKDAIVRLKQLRIF
jgi:hypothetical protein